MIILVRSDWLCYKLQSSAHRWEVSQYKQMNIRGFKLLEHALQCHCYDISVSFSYVSFTEHVLPIDSRQTCFMAYFSSPLKCRYFMFAVNLVCQHIYVCTFIYTHVIFWVQSKKVIVWLWSANNKVYKVPKKEIK